VNRYKGRFLFSDILIKLVIIQFVCDGEDR
jgi:hypothetical protein